MNALISVVSIGVLLFVCVPLFNDYRIDRTRQDLFAIRDRLFDAAMRGEVDIDSQAYRTTRLIINGLIRFTHRASVLRVWLMVIFGTRANDVVSREIAAAFNASGAKDREICVQYLNESNSVCASHFASSPYMMLLVIPVVVRFLAGRSKNFFGLMRMDTGLFRVLDREAYAEGHPCV